MASVAASGQAGTQAGAVRAFYLAAGADPVFTLHHQAPGDIGVVIVPPFGWDEVCSYRARRVWAQRLAAVGHPVLRIDLPGAGDSGGSPADPARLDAWTEAAAAAAVWLRDMAGCARVVACGLGFGGLIAYRAAASGAPIDDLVLWATPARGRAFLREVGAFARMESEQWGGETAVEPEPGALVAGGFAIHAETREALDALDLTQLVLPDATGRRILLLDRDGLPVDQRLLEHLESSGADVTVAPGPGYGAMLAEPHDARAPRATIDGVTTWLDDGGGGGAGRGRDAAPSPAAHEGAGAPAREEPFEVAQPFGSLFGVATDAIGERAGVTAVFLNAGAIRRIGPSRIWVEAARRWSERGVPAARIDLEGIGDADGDGERYSKIIQFYTAEMVAQVRAALDALGERGLQPPYVLVGLCSGAYWAFHSALEDERVAAAVMLNPRILTWDEYRLNRREAQRVVKVVRADKLEEVLRGEKRLSLLLSIASAVIAVAVTTLVRWPGRLLARVRAQRSGDDEIDDMLDRLRDSGKRAVLAFSDAEPLYDEFEREGRLARLERWPNLRLERLGLPDHTLRPSQSQRRAHEVIDAALEAELERLAPRR